MRRNKPAAHTGAPRTFVGLVAQIAALGLGLIDATSGQARTKPIEGIRLAESPQPISSGDSYQDGKSLLASGDLAGSVAAFRAALVAAPQSVDALNGLAVAYDRMGRYDVSRSYYDAALAIDPGAALVLNNLGYSLFLQGKYQAAIPLLQKVTASNDAAARNSGQRVLNLIAARMRTDAAAKSTAIAVAELAQPQARIEQSASGEQRLVLAAPAPDAALVASLGDDAALVMVAKPWTPREDAALAARQAAADRTAAAARLADALSAPRASAAPALIVQTSQQTDELTARLATIAPRKADPEVIAANAPRPDQNLPPAPPVMDRPGIDANAAIRLAAAARSRIDAALASGVESIVAASDAIDAAAYAAARRAANGSFRRTRTLRAPAGLAFQQDILSVDQTPAWLLLSRRDPVADDRVAEFRHEPHGDDGSAAFDSDDGDLNSFAARMRGVESAAAVSTDDAVARLEGLLRRLRAA